MTGFGLGEVQLEAGRVIVELRSVNHRYSDVRVRLPPELLDLTFFVEQLGRKLLGRGRFDLNVRIEGDDFATPSLVPERLRALYKCLSELRLELCPESPLGLGDLLVTPGVFSAKNPANDVHLQKAIGIAFECAIENLNCMRDAEGEALAQQLMRHVEKSRQLVDKCRDQAAHITPSLRCRLQERLERLLDGTSRHLDEVRLEQEIALLAERSDVTEELTRIYSHLDQFASMLDSPEPVGRRLDFLLQEVARESNTLGAKSQDASLSHLVVELKAEVEKMREQVQNVE